ncbi:hypothetical protein [Streptomyces sp. NBC_01190]|uniref:hypothetical protein n=1 Tax=Streptomyces sp. NBC_01190 TaxID=2903767 RepID=UPI0038677B69|nr:hypothetical protein OG519_19310 [Streptomyces sp. NBC_01190]
MWYTRLVVRQAEGDTFLWQRRGSAPTIDATYGDPRLAEIRAAARAGDAGKWPLIRERLAAAADAEDLTFLVEGMATVSGAERWIGEVVAAAPDDPLALLVSGARHIAWAWHARGGDAALSVPEPQRRLFRARLESAEEHLREVAEREPLWAAPRYFLQISGRGLDAGQESAERRFEATRSRAPGHAAAHREWVRQLSRTWGGSPERMHAFAREAMLAAPAGGPLGELVALAHLEEWVDRGADPESGYLGSPGVLAALHEAAARSVFHPAFVRHRDWTLPFNTFAMAFSLAADPAARPLFRTLKNRATPTPWHHLDPRSPLVPYLAHRTRTLR